jgi:hypothetical protein
MNIKSQVINLLVSMHLSEPVAARLGELASVEYGRQIKAANGNLKDQSIGKANSDGWTKVRLVSVDKVKETSGLRILRFCKQLDKAKTELSVCKVSWDKCPISEDIDQAVKFVTEKPVDGLTETKPTVDGLLDLVKEVYK